MSVEVLKSTKENEDARVIMRQRGIDCTGTWLSGVLKKYGLMKGINVGDLKKSWDVLKTVEFLEHHLGKADPVLDIGACRSEMLPILNRLGFVDLTGIDLADKIMKMPEAEKIRYRVADCYQTPFTDASFAAVTAISVIEHGFHRERLLAELSRIVRSGGFFVASVDYWPAKIDTTGVVAYNMEWSIFSQEELTSFMADAARFGFHPVGATNYTTTDPTMEWLGKRFTFAWLALRKA